MGLPIALRVGEPKLALLAAGLTCGIVACLGYDFDNLACSFVTSACVFWCAGLTGSLDAVKGSR